MSVKTFWKAWADLQGEFCSRGWTARKSEGLVVPYFRTEFNRCAEHAALNRTLNGKTSEVIGNGWHQVAVACRTNDMRKVDSGWHATLFEMLVWVAFQRPGDRLGAVQQLTADTVRLLTGRFELDVERIAVLAFGGGEVLPGTRLPEDSAWRNVWLDLGIPRKQIHMVPGPKNYLLFVGNGERCGAKCEILYRAETSIGERWVEIGTLIADDSLILRKADRPWRIVPAAAIAAGSALGAERLQTVMERRSMMTDIAMLKPLLRTVAGRVEASTRRLFEGDIRVLIDQSKACAFLISDSTLQQGTPQAELLAVMARRIRRKLATLGLTDWCSVMRDLGRQLEAIFGGRHPQLQGAGDRLIELVATVPWPEGWSPESYCGLRDEK